MRHSPASRHGRERGAVLVTVALTMFLLLAFVGMALDTGRLFVAKSELQTAMDSCALAAAQELDGQAGAVTRARNAGRGAGNTNRVGFQSSTWGGFTKVTDADMTFHNGVDYAVTTSDAAARYAECAHTV